MRELGIGTYTASIASSIPHPRPSDSALSTSVSSTGHSDDSHDRPYANGLFKSNGAEPSSSKTNPFHPIATATMDTAVFDVVHMFSEQGISAVPIIGPNGKVLDLYETVDVIVSALIR